MREDHLQYHWEAEGTHWWFVARARIVLAALRRALGPAPVERPRALLDAGCGAGGMLVALGEFGRVAGFDNSPRAVEYAIERSGADVRLGMLPHDVPFPDAGFDAITLLDVLEHVPDEAGALRRLYALLRPGGCMVVTVPAYQFLWSEHDVVNEHCRRYTRNRLLAALRGAGFTVEKSSYFNTLLFPPILAVRLLGRLFPREGRADHGQVPGPLNALLTRVFAAEGRVLARGSLPFGVSVLAVARKPMMNGRGAQHEE